MWRGRLGELCDGPGHDAIGLRISPNHEDLRTEIDEAALTVERLATLVALPHAEPERTRTDAISLHVDVTHQRLRDALAVPLPRHIKPPKLDRRAAFHAWRRRS